MKGLLHNPKLPLIHNKDVWSLWSIGFHQEDMVATIIKHSINRLFSILKDMQFLEAVIGVLANIECQYQEDYKNLILGRIDI